MQVCAFFFNTKEKKRFVPPSPALRPVHGGKQSPCSATLALRSPASGRRNPPRSSASTVGARLPPLRQPAAALPARRSDGDPAETARATPASLALSCFWNAGGEGRASWEISAPASSRPPPRPASLAAGPGTGERDTAVSQLGAHLARPTHRPKERKAAATSRAPRRARAAPCPEGPRGPPRVAGQPRH